MKSGEWNELSELPICEESITSLFSDKTLYRVSKSTYKSNESYAGTLATRAIIICLSGGCRYTIQDGDIDIGSAQYATLPPGNYHFYTTSAEEAVVFKIYELHKKH